MAEYTAEIASAKEDRSRAVFVAYRRLLKVVGSDARDAYITIRSAKACGGCAVDITFSRTEIAKTHKPSVFFAVFLSLFVGDIILASFRSGFVKKM